MSIWIIKADNPFEDAAVAAVRDRLRSGDLTATGTGKVNVPETVREIIDDVRLRGDEAVIDHTERLEGVHLIRERLRVSPEQISEAHRNADEDFLELMRRVIANIREYQQSILLKAPPVLERGGRTLGVRYTPLDRAGVYVPGGRAMYPSTVLMTVVPAQVAGVREIALLSPPTAGRDVNPMVLALAGELGVKEVYRASGTPGIAALGLGTQSIPAVHKIVGPGNAFIAEAKKQLFGRVGIDSIAGPSEVLIVADDTADAGWVAADLLAQAEHDPGSAILVTPSAKLARGVAMAIEDQIERLERREALRSALQTYSAIIVVRDLEAACEVANDFATEHLQIITAEDDACLERIRHGGAVFVGPHTPVPLGDYYAGPSHVLPTGGTARFFGPLSCNDFLKASSVVRYDAASLEADADDVIDFASREGLTAHAASVRIRARN